MTLLCSCEIGSPRQCQPDALDADQRQARIDPREVVRVAGDDGMVTFPSAQGDVHIDDVGVATVGTHLADGAGHAERHDRDIHVRDLSSRANLTCCPPRHASRRPRPECRSIRPAATLRPAEPASEALTPDGRERSGRRCPT